MRTIYTVLAVIALGVAASFVTAGWDQAVGVDVDTGLDSPDELEEQASKHNPQDGVSGSASNADDGDIVGLIIGGGKQIATIAGMAIMLPWELRDLGLPGWAAAPLGFAVQIVVVVGVIQFAVNREWR